MNPNNMKATWSEGNAALGLWLMSVNPVATEQLGQLGFDYICLDLQHGLIDYTDAVAMLQALSSSPTTVVCRVPWNEPGIIGKLLDAGAMGIIVPMVNSAAEAEAAVRACRYAPDGARSFGPVRAAAVHGRGYAVEANAEVACIPMIETAEAIANLDEILDVPGVDAVYVGPADLSLTLGLPPGSDNDDQAFVDALAAVVDGAKRRGIVAGIHSIPTVATKRLEQGFRMVTVTSDIQGLMEGTKAGLDQVKGEAARGDQSLY
ncbi:MAG: HpcH/HpaI aldolase family protein [Acidimicrobiales bacterium]